MAGTWLKTYIELYVGIASNTLPTFIIRCCSTPDSKWAKQRAIRTERRRKRWLRPQWHFAQNWKVSVLSLIDIVRVDETILNRSEPNNNNNNAIKLNKTLLGTSGTIALCLTPSRLRHCIGIIWLGIASSSHGNNFVITLSWLFKENWFPGNGRR